MVKIATLSGKKILDSRESETIEVSVVLDNGIASSAALPQGVSRGNNEAVYAEPDKAIDNLKNIIEPALSGMDADDQAKLDLKLIELDGTVNKSKLGANAILGVSLACARASAETAQQPLWQKFRDVYGEKVSADHQLRLFINVIEGGLHTKGNLQFQEYLIIPEGSNFHESITWGKSIYDELETLLSSRFGKSGSVLGDEGGFAPPLSDDLAPFEILRKAVDKLGLSGKIKFGLDAAGSNLKSSVAELFPVYRQMKDKFDLFYLEDPFGEEDFKNFAELHKEFGNDVKITGDDLTVTNMSRMKEAKDRNSINGIIIKPNQIGTVTETIQAIKTAKMWQWYVVVSHRGGETMDNFVADLAFGTGADGFKLGSPSRLERLVKYSRLLKIEEELNK